MIDIDNIERSDPVYSVWHVDTSDFVCALVARQGRSEHVCSSLIAKSADK